MSIVGVSGLGSYKVKWSVGLYEDVKDGIGV